MLAHCLKQGPGAVSAAMALFASVSEDPSTVLKLASAGAVAVGQITGQFDVETLKAALGQSTRNEKKHLTGVHAFVKAQSELLVRSFDTSLRDRVADVDNAIMDAITEGRYGVARHLLKRRQTVLLSYPSEVVPLLGGTAVLDVAEQNRLAIIDANVKALLADYGHIPELETAIRDIRDHSLQRQPAARVQLYLVGAPGVGKTVFVERLARALGLPLHARTLQNTQVEGVSKAQYGMTNAYSFQDETKTDEEVLLTIPYGLSRAGCINPIIFFDEAAVVINAPLPMYSGMGQGMSIDDINALFGPGKKSLSATSVSNTFFDFSHATIIFSGNQPPENRAFLNRVRLINFAPVPSATKKIIAQKTMYQSSHDIRRIADETKAQTYTEALQYLNMLLDADALSQEAGARVIQDAAALVVSKVRASHEAGGTHKEAIVDELVKFYGLPKTAREDLLEEPRWFDAQEA